MSFQEVVMLMPQSSVEAWSDALIEAGALAVSVEDADADSPEEQPLYGEPGTSPDVLAWNESRLVALLAEGDDPAQLLSVAAEALEASLPPYTMRLVADQDWVRLTQSQYEPIPVGERLLISPSWHAQAADDNRIRIIVDPGLAFGTGSHPTTHLCLQWLEQQVRPELSLIDYGCGSGILAIAAARLGAKAVCGIDIDPQALVATAANAHINQVLVEVRSTDQALPAATDLVVANILASPLKLLAPLLIGLVRPQGKLALSGVLERQIDEVCTVYRQHGFALVPFAVRDGWACLSGSASQA
jgi:ribosomal protein L11 methyltransferase